MDSGISSLGRCLDGALERADSLLGRRRHGRMGEWRLAILLLLPAAIVLGAFGIAPLLRAVYISFFEGYGAGDAFVGWANYTRAFSSEAFRDSFLVTVYFALGTIPASLCISFVIANALFRIQVLRSFLRTIYFLPYLTSTVAAAMVWRALLDPTGGAANVVLEAFGLPAQNWLLEPRGIFHILTDGLIPPGIGPSMALCCVIFFEIWHGSGIMILLILAGLAAIPRELEDAARLDGAHTLQVSWNVTIPLLSPVLFFLAVVGLIKSFQAFDSIYALTGDGHGPLDTTQNMTVYIFSNFYEYQRMGYGTAVATLLCLLIVLLTLMQWRVAGTRVHYQ